MRIKLTSVFVDDQEKGSQVHAEVLVSVKKRNCRPGTTNPHFGQDGLESRVAVASSSTKALRSLLQKDHGSVRPARTVKRNR